MPTSEKSVEIHVDMPYEPKLRVNQMTIRITLVLNSFPWKSSAIVDSFSFWLTVESVEDALREEVLDP